MYKLFPLIAIFFFLCSPVKAQMEEMKEIRAVKFDPFTKNNYDIFEDENFSLPPLHVLIDSALVYSPILKIGISQKTIAEYNMQDTENDWLKYFAGKAAYGYGTADDYDFTTGNDGLYYGEGETKITNRYNVSLSFNLNFFDLLSRRRRLKMAQEELNMAGYSIEQIYQKTREDIIKLYNEVILAQRLLVIKSEIKQATLINFEIAEQQFQNGELDLKNYSDFLQSMGAISMEFEQARIQLKTTYALLEELVGVKIREIKYNRR